MIVANGASIGVELGWGNGGAFVTTTGNTTLALQAGANIGSSTGTGNVAIGYNLGTSYSGRLQIRGYTSGSNLTTASFYVENQAGSASFAVFDNRSVVMYGGFTSTGSAVISGSVSLTGSLSITTGRPTSILLLDL